MLAQSKTVVESQFDIAIDNAFEKDIRSSRFFNDIAYYSTPDRAMIIANDDLTIFAANSITFRCDYIFRIRDNDFVICKNRSGSIMTASKKLYNMTGIHMEYDASTECFCVKNEDDLVILKLKGIIK